MNNEDSQYLPIGEPNMAMLFDNCKRSAARSVNCHRVGKIIAFNSADFTCTVRILDKLTYLGQEEDYIDTPSLPLIIQGTGNKHITFGDIVGSECIVHYNDTDIDNWHDTGEAYMPNSSRAHSFSDGFVELRPYNKTAVFSYYTNGLEIKNGNALIHINDDGSIEITNGTSSITMNGDTVAITGKLTVSSTIVATGEITGNSVSMSTHYHTNGTKTDGNTGSPVSGS